jgi:hypothetical protein
VRLPAQDKLAVFCSGLKIDLTRPFPIQRQIVDLELCIDHR